MAFDFPASPTENQEYTPSGGPTYRYNAPRWISVGGAGGGASVTVGTTPPSSPADGDLWWESDTGRLYVYYNDGTSSQWVETSGKLGPISGTALPGNRIVNGAFQISQENGTTAGSTTLYYPVDQWQQLIAGSTGVIASGQVRGTVAPYLIMSCATALASPGANDYWLMSQNIEGNRIADFGWGTAEAKPAVLRFVVQGNLAGIYSISIRNNPAFTNYFLGSFEITAADVANYNTSIWSEKIITIPVPPSGVWPNDNTVGLQIMIALVAGSSRITTAGWGTPTSCFGVAGQVNFQSNTANRLRIRSAGLYLDPDNTGVAPKWDQPNEAEELQACQRYYWKTTSPSTFHGVRYGVASMALASAGKLAFPVTFRVTPSLAELTAGTLSNCSAPAWVISPDDAELRVTVTASAGYRVTSGVYALSARM